MVETSRTNVSNNASWDLSDILMCTPGTLADTLKRRAEYDPYGINPAVVVFDECQPFSEDHQADH